MRKKLIAVIALSAMVMATGCSKDSKDVGNIENQPTAQAQQDAGSADTSQKKNQVVLTVNDQEVTYGELVMYLQSNKEEIESVYGTEIWDMEIDEDGTTYEKLLKDSILEEIQYTKLVCSQAEALGITLSEDELLDVDEYTADFLSNFTEESLSYYDVNRDVIRTIYKDNVLANKVFESLTLNVDTNVSDEEARQAVFDYILVGKYGYDEDGNRYEYTQEQLDQAKEHAASLYEEAQTVTNFLDFAKTNSDDEDETEITVGFGDMQPELESVAFALKKGEISPVIETDDGYFIFYCVEELNRDETDAKKEEIIRDRQEESFNEKYALWDEQKKVDLDEQAWNSISLKGEIVQ